MWAIRIRGKPFIVCRGSDKPDFDKIYADMEETYAKLIEQGGEFNITYETLQDKDKRKAIAETISMFGKHYED